MIFLPAILLVGMPQRRSLVASRRRLVPYGGSPENRRRFCGGSSHFGICIIARLRARNRSKGRRFRPVTQVLECLCQELQGCCSRSLAAAQVARFPSPPPRSLPLLI